MFSSSLNSSVFLPDNRWVISGLIRSKAGPAISGFPASNGFRFLYTNQSNGFDSWNDARDLTGFFVQNIKPSGSKKDLCKRNANSTAEINWNLSSVTAECASFEYFPPADVVQYLYLRAVRGWSIISGGSLLTQAQLCEQPHSATARQ